MILQKLNNHILFMQLDLLDVSNKENIPQNQQVGESVLGGHFILHRQFIQKQPSQDYFNRLLDVIDWQEEVIDMFGKQVLCPRLTYWMGDKDSYYNYSKINHAPNPWLAEVVEIKNLIENLYSKQFNSCLLNLYRNHSDSVSWHKDNEPELGREPVIASVSLGESRVFELKHVQTKEKYQLPLHSGDLLVMRGWSQRDWMHQLPKQKQTCGARINLTFRTIF